MRKPKYEFGNVGPNYMGEKKDKKRCNCCNFLNGMDGSRIMHRDQQAGLFGGWVCDVCQKATEGKTLVSYKQQEEDWYIDNKIYIEGKSVDNVPNRSDYIEELATEFEKQNNR